MMGRCSLFVFSLVVIFTLSFKTGDGLLCFVCIPSLVGNTQHQLIASKVRANISRTFRGKAESDFQECGAGFDTSLPSAQVQCPWNDDTEVCLDIKHASWEARTCGRIPLDMDIACYSTNDGQNGCPCTTALCNSAESSQFTTLTTTAIYISVYVIARWRDCF